MTTLNPYQSGAQKCIPAVLIYAFDPRGRVLLLQKKNGIWNGLGGKLELGESFRLAAAREFAEESGVGVPEDRLQWLGSVHFPNFIPQKSEDWHVQVFRCELTADEASRIKSAESEPVAFHDVLGLTKLAMWPGDVCFLPHVLSARIFEGTIWYTDGNVRRSDVRVLSLKT